VTFAESPKILNACSPSDSEGSVSFSTGPVISADKQSFAVDAEDLPPPRPRKNSGPPNFKPPPPPQEQKITED